ncbi:MAG: multicopper oxidase domain-containing protein [Chloroflexi bacterium]|nr:multicopper oxidase domain-containing protein [Chloroflexota bacterium]
MGIHIVKSERRKQEKIVGRYVQEIRDIQKAGFSRRELLRMGLVAGGAGILAVSGMRDFRPYWAHAADLQLISPPNTPFQDPLPIPSAMTPVTLSPAPTKATNPTPVPSARPVVGGFTEAARPEHQRWTEFGGVSDTLLGFSGRQYESIEMAVPHHYYPTVDGVPPSTLWTFVEAGTGKVGPLRLQARYGEPVLHRVHNALPVDNGGFGINQTSTHLHNGHTASESDGGPTHFYDAGHFKDFHYPNVRAGFASTHPTSTLNGRTVPGDVRETMSFLFFHDHRFDFTAQNVYKGLLSLYHLFSDDIDLDTGDETTGLRLPSGEFDIPMVFTDKVFDPTTGQLFFDLFNIDGILGDKFAVNGKIQPFLEVKKRRYRFRLLNAGPARVYEFFFSSGQPFIQISNDGNLLPRPLTRRSMRMAAAERADVIADFSGASVGDKIYLQNRLEQEDGRGPTGKIVAPTDIVEFRVVGPENVADPSRVPGQLLDLPDQRPVARERLFHFDRQGGAWTINNEMFEPDVIRAFPKQGSAERWTLTSGNGWLHPVHIHLEEFLLLSRSDQPIPEDEISRLDIVRLGRNAEGTRNTGELKIFLQFRDFLGDYPVHCHNILHEDHSMMFRFQVVP